MARRWEEVYTFQLLWEVPPDGREGTAYRHLTIERRDGKPVRCGWDTLQAIKNEVAGEDSYFVEVFPPVSALVDEVNRRHFWEVPPGEPLRTRWGR